MEKLAELKIGGREIPMYYSTYETIAIQRDIGCTAFQLKDKVFGVEKVDEDGDESLGNIRLNIVDDPEKMEKLAKLIRILGNAGLEEDGQEPNLTDKWILRHMRPSMLTIYAMTMMAVITAGNMMEAKAEDNKGEETDVILEEEKAKKQQGN